MTTIYDELRTVIDKMEAESTKHQRMILPHDQNPRASMPLTDDGEYFKDSWWMEGYVGALAGVRLSDWRSEQFIQSQIGNGRPQHFSVLIPNAGQVTVSPADLGWIDATWFDPNNFPDQTECTAAWMRAGSPTVGPRGKFDVRGQYIPSGSQHSFAG